MHDSENHKSMNAVLIQTPLNFFIVLHLCARSDPARTDKDHLSVGGMSILENPSLNVARSKAQGGPFCVCSNQAVRMCAGERTPLRPSSNSKCTSHQSHQWNIFSVKVGAAERSKPARQANGAVSRQALGHNACKARQLYHSLRARTTAYQAFKLRSMKALNRQTRAQDIIWVHREGLKGLGSIAGRRTW